MLCPAGNGAAVDPGGIEALLTAEPSPRHQRIPPPIVPSVPATMERLTLELAIHQLRNRHD